jgi:trk system potassium uptake protein TrkA
MNIIIIGCGKVGISLAEQLSDENHNITLIDSSAETLQNVSDDLDAMRIYGNGASISTLMEAGLEDADILIAVTGSDELNLLCCLLAKKRGNCNTIARVRNPLYSKELNFIKESIGLSMIINPELAAATEIARILRFPSAIRIDTFAKGRVELLKFKLKQEVPLSGLRILDIMNQYRCDILFCGVERENQVFIPDGNFTLQNGDLISLIATPKNAAEFFRKVGLKTNQVKNAMIVGGGAIAYYLAKQLLDMKIRVRIIELDKVRCETLSELLPEVTIVNGDGTNKELLMQEGLLHAESFITLTNLDEENILLSLYAKQMADIKLVTKVNRIAYTEILDHLDLGSVIYPKYITAEYILQYVRAMQNSIGSNVETLYQILDNRAEALEFAVHEDNAVTGIPLSKLSLKKNLLIGSINRNGQTWIPRGQDCIKAGDSVIVITTQIGLQDLTDILQK